MHLHSIRSHGDRFDIQFEWIHRWSVDRNLDLFLLRILGDDELKSYFKMTSGECDELNRVNYMKMQNIIKVKKKKKDL